MMKIYTAVLAASVVGPTYLVSGAVTGPTECMSGFLGLNFSPSNFARYPEYFHDDSTITLAQAGTFQGPSAIEEYVHFTTPFSPLVSAVAPSGPSVNSIVRIERDVCVFSLMLMRTFEMNDALLGAWPPIDVASLFHFYYNVTGNYIQKWTVFYEVPWLEFSFTTLVNTSQVNDLICNTMTEKCGFDVDSTGPCQEQLNSLPSLTDVSYADGNSKGCRTLHATMAIENPYHCAHISFDEMPDPSGRIKCQNSELVDPMDLFDIDSVDAFRAFYQAQGIDLGVGYRIATSPPMSASPVSSSPVTPGPSSAHSKSAKRAKSGRTLA